MRLTNLLRTTASAAVVGAVVFGFAGAASAQTAPQTAPTTVDDIIVTAQKREQNLQDVPIVVTSLSGETLANAGVHDIKDLQILTPGMTVTSTASETSTTARIRGVGTVGDNPGLESSVGVVIDGVYRSRNSIGFGDLGELARIEVLKGPQGTLFGKNTSAGVINILTEAPAFTPGFNAELTTGNFGQMRASGSVTGPLTDQLAFRVFAARGVRSGYNDIDLGDGPRTNQHDNNQDFFTARGQLLWLPNDNTSFRLIADYTNRDEYCCVGVQIRTGPTYPFVDGLSNGTGQRPPANTTTYPALPFSRTAFANRDDAQMVEDRGVSLEANFDMPSMDATLTSVTSWRDWKSDLGQDIDFTGADILYRDRNGDYGYGAKNITEELRLAGKTASVDWLIGGFATKEDISRKDSYFFGADYTPFLSFLLSAGINKVNPAIPVSAGDVGCFTRVAQTAVGLGNCLGTGGAVSGGGIGFITGQGVRDNYDQESTSFAVFTNDTWHVTEQFDITLGLRYTMDDKSLDAQQRNINGNGNTCNATLANAGAIGAVLGASAPTIIGTICLPWANSAFTNRDISESHDDGELSGTIKAAFRLSPEVMLYGSYARGYKSFGYNLDRVQSGITPAASTFFPSEVVDSYEGGVKMTLLNRTLLLNATYFDQTFNDFQLNTFLGTAFVVESIPELTSRGVDADMLWFTPIEGLSFQGGVTWTDAQYGNFTAADLTSPGNFPQLSLLPGSRASFAPEWSSTLAVNFERNLSGDLRAGFSLAAKYMSDYNTGSDLLPFKQQDAYTTVNGRFTVGTVDERWTAEFWVQNLTDEEYVQVAYNAPLQGTAFQSTVQAGGSNPGTYYDAAKDTQTYDAFLGQPRTYGATLRFRY